MIAPLDVFKQAIEGGDEQRAVEVASPLLDEINRRSDIERGVETAARIVATDLSASEESGDAARTVIQRIKTIEGIRTTLSQHILGLANGLLDPENTLETLTALEASRGNLEEAVSDFRGTDAANDLGPVLLVLPQINPVELTSGVALDAAVAVINAGGSPATDIGISVESDLDVTAEPSKVGTLAAGETESITLTSKPLDTDGSFSIQVSAADAEGETDFRNIRIVVLSTTTYLEDVVVVLNDLEDRIVTLLDRRSARPFQNRIEKIRADVVELHSEIVDEQIDDEEVVKRIEREIKWTNALNGLVRSSNQISDLIQASLQTDVDTIIQKLENAKSTRSD